MEMFVCAVPYSDAPLLLLNQHNIHNILQDFLVVVALKASTLILIFC